MIRTIFRISVLSFTIFLLGACHQISKDKHWQQWADLESDALDEISGLARSHRDTKLFWGHNDSGSGAYVYAFDRHGKHLSRVTLMDTGNRDWEDMSSFQWNGQPWLVIGDVGDNHSQHSELRLQFLVEPELSSAAMELELTTDYTYSFVYPDGARDSESIAIDATEESIYILTKRDVPARLYRLPLRFSNTQTPATAEFIGTLPHIPQPSAIEQLHASPHGRWSAQPTALDFAPDGSSAAVLTYKSVFVFTRAEGQSWAQALAGEPIQYLLPALKQAESLAYLGPQRILVSSEKRPAPLWLLTLQ